MNSKRQNKTRRHRKMMNRLKDKEIILPELPEDIMVEILTKIPPEFLCKTVGHVCKEWDRLMSSSDLIHKNAMYHNPGLLVQVLWRHASKTSFLRHTDDEKQLGFDVTKFPSTIGTISSSCNGLVLVTEPSRSTSSKTEKHLCVKNPLTGLAFTLPNCPSGCKHDPCRGSGLGFDPVTKQYKVVHVDGDSHGFEVFTVGSDHNEWRRVDPGPFEGPYDIAFDIKDFRWGKAVSINGQVLHWFVESENYIISMDVSNEKVSKTKLPDIEETINIELYDLVDMDGKLGFVYKTSEFKIDVWVLNDFGRQIWSKEHSILAGNTNYLATSEAKNGKNDEKEKNKLPHFTNLTPIATMRNGEVMMLMKHDKKFCNHHSIYLYDFKSKEMKKSKMKMKDDTIFIPHRSSLVSWKTDMDHLSATLSNIEL